MLQYRFEIKKLKKKKYTGTSFTFKVPWRIKQLSMPDGARVTEKVIYNSQLLNQIMMIFQLYNDRIYLGVIQVWYV